MLWRNRMSQINKHAAGQRFLIWMSAAKRVFEQVGLLLENSEKLSRSTVFDSLFARERLWSTRFGAWCCHSAWAYQGDCARRWEC